MSMLCIRSATQPWLSLTLMKPGPASVGRSAIMEEAGSASTIAFATSVGFLGAPSCRISKLVSAGCNDLGVNKMHMPDEPALNPLWHPAVAQLHDDEAGPASIGRCGIIEEAGGAFAVAFATSVGFLEHTPELQAQCIRLVEKKTGTSLPCRDTTPAEKLSRHSKTWHTLEMAAAPGSMVKSD